MVLRVCRGVLGPVDAEDAWSETFLAAMRSYPQLPADADTAAWLVTIAHRKAIDVRRAERRRAVPLADPPDQPSTSSDAVPGVADEHDDLYAALAELPDRQRLTVAYHYLGGHRYAEIAELIGGTEAAARRAAADGIKALRVRNLTTAGALR